MQANVEQGPEGIVQTYFRLVRDLRNGQEEALPRLMELWDQDGVFEFAGAAPVVGTYSGAMAIETLYKNRLHSYRMGIDIETNAARPERVTLAIVDTDVTHLRVQENRAIAGWRTTIGTREGHGFDVAGSHRFAFEGGKIKSLRVTVSPKADSSHLSELSLDQLSVADIGRLSVAAWPVV